MPTLIDGHYDQLATNWSLAYQQNADGFIAGRGASVVPVALQSGLYLRYKREAWFRSDAGPRALGGLPHRTSLGTDTASYFCEERALEYLLDDRQVNNATPPFDPRRSAVELITQQMMLDRDIQFCSKVMGTGIWTKDWTGVGSGANNTSTTLQWDVTGATPGEFVRGQKNAVKKLTGMMPNTLTLGADTAVQVFNTTDFLERVKYTKGGVFDASDMAAYFDVQQVLIATAVKNTADEGQTHAGSFVAGSKDALLSYVDPNPGLEKPTSVVAFAWTGLMPGAWQASVVETFREDRRHSEAFQVRTAYDIEVVAPDLGVYFHSIVS